MIDKEREYQASILRGSLLEFTKFFLKYITQRDYVVSRPVCRESHQVIICRELTKLLRLETPSQRLIINVPPGHGKSLHVSMWIAWCYTHYPDCNFLYISYSHDLASKHTAFIKQIMNSEIYRYLFGIHIKQDSRAKDHFVTSAGGTVAAFGAQGSITGRDSGLPGLNRFSGACIIDDPIKPDAAHSEAIRGTVISNYDETIRQRLRGPNVPILFIGQRLHEDDLAAHLLSGKDTRPWDSVILKAIDDAGNALCEDVITKTELLSLQEKSPYVYSSQYMQEPLPAGGALFKPQWFLEFNEDPEILLTFITADTAETSKSWNDATVFSFWGLYEMEVFGRKTGEMALHWLDMEELRVEPKDLKDAFLDFWQECSRHEIPPMLAAIEKKSSGVTLLSVLDEMQGLKIRDIQRTRASGSKTDRFLEMQPYISAKRVTFTAGARHLHHCKLHMSKITANNTHKNDDVCDTAYDAIKIALIDKTLHTLHNKHNSASDVLSSLGAKMRRQHIARTNRDGIR